MIRLRDASAVLLLLCLSASPLAAAEPGRASGSVTINGTTSKMAFAGLTSEENLFDSAKKDTIIVLTDRPLGDTDAGDDVGLSMKARNGELTVLALRLDGSKLVNVKVSYKGMDGYVQLPGAWFQYAPAGRNAGTLKLARRTWEGTRYECSVEFAAVAAPKPHAPAAARPEPAPAPRESAPAPLPPATTSNLDPKAAIALFVQALMAKNEHQAIELIKLGVDPNGRDQYGVPMLNWAVMVCQPRVVQALVDRKADLTYQRAPGLTILQEAGACPEAAKILKAAGAK